MNVSFSCILDLQTNLLNLTPENYNEVFNKILNIEGFNSNKLLLLQIINSIKSIFKINDEKSELSMKLILDLFPYLKNSISNEWIFHLFPFQDFKTIMFNLIKAGFISIDFLKSKYSRGSIEYDYYIDPRDDDLKIKGINNNEITVAIRSDDLIKFQEILEKSNLNLNSNIEYSPFEKFKYINSRPFIIEFTAFFGSINIFKFLWLRKVRITPNLPKYAVAGGNCEIIHIIEEVNASFDGCLEVAIEFFQTDLIKYINKSLSYEFTTSCLISSIINYNIKYFLKIIKLNKNINELSQYGFGNKISALHAASENGLIDIVQFLCSIPGIDINITTPNLLITPLHMAAGNGHLDVVKYLCGLEGIKINAEQCIFINFYTHRIIYLFFVMEFYLLI